MAFVFWLVGILTGALCVKFAGVLKKMDWYWWILVAFWYAFGVFTTAFAQTSFAEGESQAGWMAVTIFGGIFVVLGVVIYMFGIRKAAVKAKAAKVA